MIKENDVIVLEEGNDDDEYVVVWVSNPSRVIIYYQGLYVLADWGSVGTYNAWTLSGSVADAREHAELERLTAGMRDKSVVTVLEKP